VLICRACHRLSRCVLGSFEQSKEDYCSLCGDKGIVLICEGRDINRNPDHKTVDRQVPFPPAAHG
jgi:hypothetical protein